MGKGWFKTEHNDGDRSLDQQLVGLGRLMDEVVGLHVLDVGCAEGLISFELLRHGAAGVVGVDIVAPHIERARHASADVPGAAQKTEFLVGDARSYQPAPVDVVLLLAVLHKLKDPYETAVKFAKAAKRMCVVRLPPGNAVFKDARSGNVPIDVTAAMREGGLELHDELLGTFDEWIGYYVRPAAKPAAVGSQSVAADAALVKGADDETNRLARTMAHANALGVRAAVMGDPAQKAEAAGIFHAAKTEADAIDKAQQEREHPAHETTPPPNSVHPGGDPAEQLPIEKIEPLPLEGHEGAERREPAAD